MTRTASIGLILALVLFGGACTSKGPPEIVVVPASAIPFRSPSARLTMSVSIGSLSAVRRQLSVAPAPVVVFSTSAFALTT